MSWVKVVIRMSVVLAVSLSALAVGVARLVPKVEPGPSAARPSHSEFVEVNNYSIPYDNGCRFLDPQTGKLISIKLDDTDSLLFAKTSPWEDDEGQSEVVGRWVSKVAGGWSGGVQQIGLARFRFPSGEAVDHLPLDIVPSGNPCWFPGKGSRILYAGTDGVLYRVEFANRVGRSGEHEPSRPTVLEWSCPMPGQGGARIGDPTWPSDPRMKGRIVVSMTYLDRIDGQEKYVPEQIWWLELDRDGTSIVAAGRLTSQRPGSRAATQDRLPSLATTSDHDLVMAYLSRPLGQSTWDLQLVPIGFGKESGEPRARARSSVQLARNVVVTFPAFSADGRWVHGIRMPVHSLEQAERFSVAGALAARPRPELSWRADPGRAAERRHWSAAPLRGLRPDRVPTKS